MTTPLGPDIDLSPTPPEEANYRASTTKSDTCFSCQYFKDGVCSEWNARVSSDMICDEYAEGGTETSSLNVNNERPETNAVDFVPKTFLSEMFFSSPIEASRTDADDGSLLWKPILRTGDWKLTPGKGQRPVPKPLHVRLDGTSDPAAGIVSLDELKRAFDSRAVEHVTVPLSHADRVDENTGFVRQLKIEERDGGHVLMAGIEFTEDEIAEKARRGTIANTSSGIFFNHFRKGDGQRFNSVLDHVALTNKPWIDGMQPFGLSEQDVEELDEIQSLEFADTVWDGSKSYKNLHSMVERELYGDVMRDVAVPADYYVHDVMEDRALVSNSKGQHFVAPFSVESGRAKIAPAHEWIAARQEWVGLSERPERVEEEPETSGSAGSPVALPSSPPPSSPQHELREIQQSREVRFAESRNESTQGGDPVEKDPKVTKTEETEPAKLTLSQEDFDRQKQELEALKAEQAELREEVKQRRVDDRIDELKAMGLSEYPGLLVEVRNVMLSDDGGAALLLSEEKDGETATSKLTVTDVVERFIGALPKEDGKIVLSEQAQTLAPEKENESKPPVDEDKKSDEDRATEARTFLYG